MQDKLIAAAERIVEQWDKHDKFRPADMIEEFGEPVEVAIARAYLDAVKAH